MDLVTPFAFEFVDCRRQLAQICAFVDPRCKKGAQQAPPRPNNWSKARKTYLQSPQKRPSVKKERANFTGGNKNTKEHHSRAAGAPKTQDGLQQNERGETSNDNQNQNTTCDSPDACALPSRKNNDFLHGSTVFSTMLQNKQEVAKCT